jgi:hypothetical protein
MLLLVPFAFVLVVVALLGLAGFGPLASERVDGRSGILGGFGPVLALLVGLGLIALNVVVFAVLMGVSGGDGDGAARVDRSVTTTTVSSAAPPAERSRGVNVTPTTRQVTIQPDDTETFPRSYAVADRLAAEAVLTVRARGFPPFARAIAEQCSPSVCANRIPVQFDEDGNAEFQYLVGGRFLAPLTRGRCRAEGERCTVVVRTHSGTQGEIQTVFVDSIPAPGRVTLSRSVDLPLDGSTVTVSVARFPPGVTADVMLCAAPAVAGPRCGAPGPATTLLVAPDGTGHARLRIVPGAVGTRRVPCERGDDCGVSVVARGVASRSPVVPISFAAPPGAAYDPGRLVLGLAIAAILVAIAAGLILRSDWSPVGEAAAPEIDDADYADLDAIIAALPPEEEPEPAGR